MNRSINRPIDRRRRRRRPRSTRAVVTEPSPRVASRPSRAVTSIGAVTSIDVFCMFYHVLSRTTRRGIVSSD